MKNMILISLVIALGTTSCTQEKKSPIEGGWLLVYGKWPGVDATYPGRMTGIDVKMWTKDCFVFAGKLQLDTLKVDSYGWGKYRFSEGNHYEEDIIYHRMSESSIGATIKMLIEIRNDTLIQQWPVDENWKLKEKYSIEKYVRLE